MSNETSTNAGGRESPRTERTVGASAAGGVLSGKVRSNVRPSIAATSRSGVSSAAGAVRTSLPSRRTVTVSASDSTSWRKCDTYTIVAPRSCRARISSNSRSDSSAVRADVGSSMMKRLASRAIARRISTFCWSATVSVRGSARAGSSIPVRSRPARRSAAAFGAGRGVRHGRPRRPERRSPGPSGAGRQSVPAR